MGEAAHFSSDCLGCAVLLCLVVCLTMLASSFLPSHQNIYSGCLGCAVLLCLVCLILLASFFLPSHLSLKHVHIISMGFLALQTERRAKGVHGTSHLSTGRTGKTASYSRSVDGGPAVHHIPPEPLIPALYSIILFFWTSQYTSFDNFILYLYKCHLS